MFSTAYSFSNVFMSFQSKNWNKKIMLAVGVLGFALSTTIAGTAQSLVLFASMRFFFGIFASAINAPIYQLIAANFPPEMRSTANSIENSGYCFGAGFASLMILIIKQFGWRAMYFIMGGAGLTLSALTFAFIKNPVIPQSEEKEVEVI